VTVQLPLGEWGARTDVLADAKRILEGAVSAHGPSGVYGMFSGGHDSLVATHLASQHPRFRAAVHINTGIGIEETREYVRETCRRMGWPLIELKPPSETYEELVLRHGFPGPMGHGMMYRRLKEKAVYNLTRDHKAHRGDRLALVAGIRRSESQRRRARGETDVKRAQVWVSPLVNWTTRDRDDYIEAKALPRNPVVAALHMSGECLCGAYAKPGELREIEFWYPAAAAAIRRLEAVVEAQGRRFCRWGHGQVGATELDAAGQGSLFDDHLCWNCNVGQAAGDGE
jgi:3'-phosphoadenosine 5'-phosphosulfate sulfotransferase (PAPS reductase)/FAD synthetase